MAGYDFGDLLEPQWVADISGNDNPADLSASGVTLTPYLGSAVNVVSFTTANLPAGANSITAVYTATGIISAGLRPRSSRMWIGRWSRPRVCRRKASP